MFTVGQRFEDKEVLEVGILDGSRMRVKHDDGHESILKMNDVAARLERAANRPTHKLIVDSAHDSSGELGLQDRPSVASQRDIRVEIQREIGQLRRELWQAVQRADREQIASTRASLVDVRVRFCNALRRRSREELEELRVRYTAAVAGETGEPGEYSKPCWGCLMEVTEITNDRCSCRWYVCACGACQCPDFWDGTKQSQPECREQRIRLGPAAYDRLVEERRARYGG